MSKHGPKYPLWEAQAIPDASPGRSDLPGRPRGKVFSSRQDLAGRFFLPVRASREGFFFPSGSKAGLGLGGPRKTRLLVQNRMTGLEAVNAPPQVTGRDRRRRQGAVRCRRG